MSTSRVAVVTGAGRGIGRAVVWRLAADGWSVIAIDAGEARHDLEALLGYRLAGPEDLAETVRGAPAGAPVYAVTADVRDRSALTAAVADGVARYGRLDGAVAAAGVIAGGQPLWETEAPIQAALVEVNLTGVANLAAATIPGMLRRPAPRAGRFVAIASAAAHRGLFSLAAYCGSKAGCVGLVRGLAADLRGTGVTANVVSPGSTKTDMLTRTAELYDLPSAAPFADQAMLARLLEPAEVAAVIGYLCSPASSAMTGAVVPADAGLTA
ncbi:MAG: mycofactocin-coupled SDR family oxidoreductase [Frankiaceae bacterium]